MIKPLDITPALLSVRAAGAYLSLSRARIYELISDGTLAAYRIGGKVVFKRGELETFIANLPEAPIKHREDA